MSRKLKHKTWRPSVSIQERNSENFRFNTSVLEFGSWGKAVCLENSQSAKTNPSESMCRPHQVRWITGDEINIEPFRAESSVIVAIYQTQTFRFCYPLKNSSSASCQLLANKPFWKWFGERNSHHSVPHLSDGNSVFFKPRKLELSFHVLWRKAIISFWRGLSHANRLFDPVGRP